MSPLEKRRRTYTELVKQQLPDQGTPEYKSPEWVRARCRKGWIIADAGGNISDLAHIEGVEPQSMVQWLKVNNPDLQRALKDATHPLTLSREQRLSRLQTVRDGRASGKGTTEIARQLGLSRGRLNFWLTLWAPYGVDMAIDAESDEDEEVAA